MSIPTKQELRRQILEKIKHQKEEEFTSKSRSIAQKFLGAPVFLKAEIILFYASFQGEADTFGLMQRALDLNKRIVLPVVEKETRHISCVEIASLEDLRPGAYGILEPQQKQKQLPLNELDLVVVPALAFDRRNFRLGRGAGYYDRFLSRLSTHTATLGLAFDFQIVDTIPGLESHDRPVQQVITN